MPKRRHEILVEAFRLCPALAFEAPFARYNDLSPPLTARIEQSDFSVMQPVERRADAISVARDGQAHPHAVQVMEAQLRPDSKKLHRWLEYPVLAHVRWDCPAGLVVVTDNQETVDWCNDQFELMRSSVRGPVAVGPRELPLMTDLDQALANPSRTAVTAIAHSGNKAMQQLLVDTYRALEPTDQEKYGELLLTTIVEICPHRQEELMSIGYLDECKALWKAQGEEQGEVRGAMRAKADAVLGVLEARGIVVPPTIRELITTCLEIERLNAWIRLAATVSTADELVALSRAV